MDQKMSIPFLLSDPVDELPGAGQSSNEASTSQKEYSCVLCPDSKRSFATKSNLTRHVRIFPIYLIVFYTNYIIIGEIRP